LEDQVLRIVAGRGAGGFAALVCGVKLAKLLGAKGMLADLGAVIVTDCWSVLGVVAGLGAALGQQS